MSEPAFGTAPIHTTEDQLELAVSPDKQAFTITYAGFEVLVDSASAPVATRVTSVVIPVEGFDEGVRVAVRVDGFAFVTDGAAGSAVVVVNGNSGVAHASPGADNDFVHEVTVDGNGTSDCRICLILVAERDSGNADSFARLNILSVDAEISRRPVEEVRAADE